MTASPTRLMLRTLPSLAGPLPDFDPAAVAETPQEQFLEWLGDAIAAGIVEPHAMTLSTVDGDGRPDARVLILKDLDERGWHFATSRESPKGMQLAGSGGVALTFYWPALGRQVRIRGDAVDLGPEAGGADFLARSPEARASAMMQAEMTSWAVYAVKPIGVEFWQGRTDRNHIRLRYEAFGEGWVRKCL